MKEYKVGPDDPYGLPSDKGYRWIVHWYQEGSYDGDGEAVAFDGEKLHIYNLGHCSCYGPFEQGYQGSVSVEDFRESAIVHVRKEVAEKVEELL